MLEIENSQVFVLGGSGLIGGGIAEGFKRAGFRVATLSNTEQAAARLTAQGYTAFHGDMGKPGLWLKTLLFCTRDSASVTRLSVHVSNGGDRRSWRCPSFGNNIAGSYRSW